MGVVDTLGQRDIRQLIYNFQKPLEPVPYKTFHCVYYLMLPHKLGASDGPVKCAQLNSSELLLLPRLMQEKSGLAMYQTCSPNN